jgi:hypothetical protein
MALNLNKGNEEEQQPAQSSKNGLNLSKTKETSQKSNFNLSKEKVSDADVTESGSSKIDESTGKSILPYVAMVVILGLGSYWYLNKNNQNEAKVETTTDSLAKDSVALNASTSQSPGDQLSSAPGNVDTTNQNIGAPISSSAASNGNSAPANSDLNDQNANLKAGSDEKLDGSLEQKARQVINGEYGNGIDRRNALGSEYRAVQAKVNALYRSGRQ